MWRQVGKANQFWLHSVSSKKVSKQGGILWIIQYTIYMLTLVILNYYKHSVPVFLCTILWNNTSLQNLLPWSPAAAAHQQSMHLNLSLILKLWKFCSRTFESNLQLLTIILNMVVTFVWFSGVGTQLWTPPISIWAIIRWAPTLTANCTRMRALSGATTVILASKLLSTSLPGSEPSNYFLTQW